MKETTRASLAVVDPGRVVAVDIETTGLKWQDRPLVVSLSRHGESGPESTVLNVGYSQEPNLFGLSGVALDVGDDAIQPMTPPEARMQALDFIGRRDILAIHEASFDIPYLLRMGVLTTSELWRTYTILDTMTLARVTGSHNSVSLANLCQEFKIINAQDEEWLGIKAMRSRMADIPYRQMLAYAHKDAKNTLALADILLEKAVALYGPYGSGGLLDEESSWSKLVSELRYFGMAIDLEALAKIKAELNSTVNSFSLRLKEAGIMAPNDRAGILKWARDNNLESHLGATPSGNLSTNSDSMELIAKNAMLPSGIREMAGLISGARSAEKALSTWVVGTEEGTDRDGRVHPLFTASGAVSYRLTCQEPNVQAYPAKYRLFTARPGCELWSFDWAQAELRLAAIYANEPGLLSIFNTPDADPHMETARLMFGPGATKEHRSLAKRANFGSIYGAGVNAIVEATGIDEGKARELIAKHRSVFPQISITSHKAEAVWTNRGFLQLLGGKRLYASQEDLMNRSYKAFNQLIQGSVAEIIKKAMLQIKEQVPGALMVNQMHDSISAEIQEGDDQSSERIVNVMENIVPEEIASRVEPRVRMKVDSSKYGDGG